MDPDIEMTDEVVTFVLEYRRKDSGKVFRVSGRDYLIKLLAVRRAVRIGADAGAWLHTHLADHGVREPWSKTRATRFTVRAVKSLEIREVETVIKEEVSP